MRHSQQLMARLLNRVCSAVSLIHIPYCPIRLLLAALPDSLYPQLCSTPSVFGWEKTKVSLFSSIQESSANQMSTCPLYFPHERNHKSRRFFLAFTCPLLGREQCEVTDLTLFNSSNLGFFFFFSSRSMLQLLHWIPAFQRGCVAYRVIESISVIHRP